MQAVLPVQVDDQLHAPIGGGDRMSDELTPAEAAKRLGKGRNFVMALINAGELQAFNIVSPSADGKPKQPRYRIPASALETWKLSRDVRIPSALDVRLRSLPRMAGAISGRLAARRDPPLPSTDQRQSA